MKHQWRFLNTLDSVAAVRHHMAFYVAAHYSEIPQAAFRGQTPDEMYFGTGADLRDRLATAKQEALGRARCWRASRTPTPGRAYRPTSQVSLPGRPPRRPRPRPTRNAGRP